MFQLVTISNGVAVVQHGATGHVYRFRPTCPGTWDRLTLDRIDVCQNALEAPAAHEGAAREFAETAATQWWMAGPPTKEHHAGLPVWSLRALMRGRAPARRHEAG